jgi:transcription antitermination factor NusG
LSFDDQPQPIPTDIVENLRQRVAAINQRGCLLDHGFQPGDTVRFKKGPLYGLEVVFQETLHPYERVRVLLEFMGQINRVDVAVGDLEQVAPKQHLPRRTRGKGRKIVPKKMLCEDTVQL